MLDHLSLGKVYVLFVVFFAAFNIAYAAIKQHKPKEGLFRDPNLFMLVNGIPKVSIDASRFITIVKLGFVWLVAKRHGRSFLFKGLNDLENREERR